MTAIIWLTTDWVKNPCLCSTEETKSPTSWMPCRGSADKHHIVISEWTIPLIQTSCSDICKNIIINSYGRWKSTDLLPASLIWSVCGFVCPLSSCESRRTNQTTSWAHSPLNTPSHRTTPLQGTAYLHRAPQEQADLFRGTWHQL